MRNRTSWIVLFLLISTIVLIVTLFFTGKQDKPSYQTSQTSPQPEIYKLSFGHDHTTSSPHHQAVLKFAELVEARSKGRVKIEIFPNQELGTGHQMIEQLREGVLPIALLPAARLTGIIPAMQYIDMPFVFSNREDAYELLEGEIGKKLYAQLEPFGLIGLAFWDSGFKQFTANRQIRQPDDYKGLKVRIMKSPIIREQFESYGAQAIPIDFHQLHQALKDGVVDAQENPLIGISEMKLYEVQPHLTISNHAYLAYIFLCSKKVMDDLPEDVLELIATTASEVTLYERQLLQEKEQEYLEIIKNAGVVIYSLSEPERLAFREATSHLRKKYRDEIGREIVDRTEELLTLKYGPGDDVVIGIDADLSLGTAIFGKAIKRGMELAVKEINGQGGVLGRKIRIVSFDHKGISARGIANIEQLAGVPNLVAVVGGLHSPVALAELEAIHSNKVIYLGPYANATQLVENGYQPNYVFRVSPPDKYAVEYMIDEALKLSDRVGLVLDNSAWGRSNQKVMTNILAKKGLTPAAVEWIGHGENEITGQLTGIINGNAGVIVLAVNPGGSMALVKGMAVRGISIPIISHWGLGATSYWREFQKEMKNTDLQFLQSFSFLDSRNKRAKDFAMRYLQEYGIDKPEHIPVPSATAQAYDLVHLLAMAIRKAGSLQRPAIRDSMEKLEPYQGLIKEYKLPFTAERHDALSKEDIFMARFDQQGTITPVSK